MKPGFWLAAMLAAAPGWAAAQTPAHERPVTPPLIHYGKWATLALAAGTTALGAVAHERADDRFTDLLTYCRTATCSLAADGRYANAGAEALFQRTVREDRAARRWLLAGQAALLTTAAMFVVELSRKGGPGNVPFAPYLAVGRVGFRLAW